MAIAFSIFASSIGGIPSAAGSSVPRETFAKIDICRFSGRRHTGQEGIRAVFTLPE
jgi:hypothetical protein